MMEEGEVSLTHSTAPQSIVSGCQGQPPKCAPYTVLEPLRWDSNSSRTQKALPLKAMLHGVGTAWTLGL